MNKKKLLLLLVTVGTLLLLGACRQKEKAGDTYSLGKDGQTLVIGLDDTFVPMGFRGEDGSIQGFDVDVAKEVFNRLGIDIRFQAIDWSMKETELENKTIDLIWNGYSKTPEREKQVLFSIPYLENHQVVLVEKKNNYQTLSDLTGEALGAQSGSSGYEALEAQPDLLENFIKDKTPILYGSFTEGFLDVKAGRIGGLLIDEIYANYYLANEKDGADYTLLPTQFETEAFAIGMRKSDTLLKEKIDTTLQEMVKDGSYGKITEKWFQEDLKLPQEQE